MSFPRLMSLLRVLIITSGILASAAAFARPVSLYTAKRAAMTQRDLMSRRSTATMGTEQSSDMLLAETMVQPVGTGEIRAIYYIFTTPDNGFVIVAGDDAVTPILGYSLAGGYSADNPSPTFVWWMKQYENQIIDAIDSGMEGTGQTRREWERLLEEKEQAESLSSEMITGVEPLLRTKWDQGEYYNTLCPYDPVERDRVPTGCVATSFAQIMKYHGAPVKGRGDHSYVHPRYGYLSANFANTTYHWSAMPNELNGPSQAVATLMYHLGVAFEMEYGPRASGAYPRDAAEALKRFFDYQPTTREVERRAYSNEAWQALIRSELDAERPVEYHGYGNGAGHSFVCDGYQGEYFSINWGWGGRSDGYFLLSNLAPNGVGTGGGAGTYNQKQGAVIGIAPLIVTAPQIDIQMNAEISASPNPVTANSRIMVELDLLNAAAKTFRGDYTVALFREDWTFVTHIGGILAGAELPPNYHYTNGITVEDTLFGLSAGTYIIAVYARPTGGEWSIAGNSRYGNAIYLYVEEADYGNDLEIYSAAAIAPDPIRAGQPFQIIVDFANRGSIDFTGRIGAFVYTLDGVPVGMVAIRENLQLGPDRHWTDGLTFASTGLAVEPGRYMIMFFSREEREEWIPVNPDEYVNPVLVEILPPLLTADRYEDNDTEAKAYRLPISFSAVNITISTSGSNLHVITDDDYYRADLPAGYEYDITARVRDSWNDSTAGYTTDVAVLWNDGSGWSVVYDDATDPIMISGGRSLFFKVQPLFAGTTGTYQLDVSVTTRGYSSAPRMTEAAVEEVRIYPLPANDHLLIDPIGKPGSKVDIRLVDATGRTVVDNRGVAQGSGPIVIDVGSHPSGSYLLVLTAGDRSLTHVVRIVR
jgi:hypothetical protein